MDGKEIANALYHGAVILGLAIGYAQLEKMIVKGPAPKLDWSTLGTVEWSCLM